MAKAVKERREFDVHEKVTFETMSQTLWDRLPENYQWLREWEYV